MNERLDYAARRPTRRLRGYLTYVVLAVAPPIFVAWLAFLVWGGWKLIWFVFG